MNPEDIPSELVLIADDALMAACDEDEDSECACPTDEQIRVTLAAVLPETQARALDDALPIIEVSGPFAYAAVEALAARLRSEAPDA